MRDPDDISVSDTQRSWRMEAIHRLKAEQTRSADTHLIELPLTAAPGIRLYLKDESSHPSGSLKHRLARSLFLHALCNGWIGRDTLVVEASSGSTAVSAAWFARLLGLRFLAVVPSSTATEKVAQIEAHGGQCRKVDDPLEVQAEAQRIAHSHKGHLLDQFTYAERATDWRGNNNIAQSIFEQMRDEPSPIPRWIVCGAGTGGTSATIGRFIRYMGHDTRLCVADPEASVFHRHFRDRSITFAKGPGSCVEGIGRARVELSFIPDAIDRMIPVTDAAGIAATHHLSKVMNRSCGPSTGVNLHACMTLIDEMITRGETGSIVTLQCDSGERYRSTCFDAGWCEERGFGESDAHPAFARLLPVTPRAL